MDRPARPGPHLARPGRRVRGITAPQQAYFQELQEQVRQALARVEAFRKEGLASLNEVLAKGELPAVVATWPRSSTTTGSQP